MPRSLSVEVIATRIYMIRGQRVMLDKDLARLCPAGLYVSPYETRCYDFEVPICDLKHGTTYGTGCYKLEVTICDLKFRNH
jgi:hypothetical protein